MVYAAVNWMLNWGNLSPINFLVLLHPKCVSVFYAIY